MAVLPVKQASKLESLVIFVDDTKKWLTRWSDPVLKDFLKTPLEKDFQAKFKETQLLYTPSHPLTKRVLVVGTGKLKDLSLHKMRSLGACITQSFATRKLDSKLGIVLPAIGKFHLEEMAEALKMGSEIYQFRYEDYKTNEGKKRPEAKHIAFDFLVPEKRDVNGVQRAVHRAETIAGGVNFARRLIMTSARQLGPSDLAKEAQMLAQRSAAKSKVRCTIWTEAELKKNKFGGVLAVAQGSDNPPRFIILEYFGAKKTDKPIVLVGKGVTFDSGGLSLKPAQGMETMKYDMAGAATCLGVFKNVTDLGLRKNLVVLIPTVENMPSGKAQRPGDIITMASGETVEVLNTDAEGRLILADALFWASTKYQPKACIDVATLTGACALAVGNAAAGYFGTNDKLKTSLVKAASDVEEGLWPLPDFDDYYVDLVSSDVADIRNTGKIREAGASTASIFLRKFVKNNIPWVHLDIAGCGWFESPRDFISQRGASGMQIRMLTRFVEASA